MDEETVSTYARMAQDYATMTADSDSDPVLTAFIGGIPRGGRVLDLGCGPGVTAAAMTRAGLYVDATDAVAEMVAMAETHPGVTAWQATFDEITGDAIYDGIWANFSLLHAPRSDMPRHLGALRRALKPGGLFHIGMKTGTGERRENLGRLYTYYTEQELCDLMRAAGLTAFSSTKGADKGLDGVVAPWVTIAAHG
jgi:trans-aconitate methyltransferase